MLKAEKEAWSSNERTAALLRDQDGAQVPAQFADVTGIQCPRCQGNLWGLHGPAEHVFPVRESPACRATGVTVSGAMFS